MTATWTFIFQPLKLQVLLCFFTKTYLIWLQFQSEFKENHLASTSLYRALRGPLDPTPIVPPAKTIHGYAHGIPHWIKVELLPFVPWMHITWPPCLPVHKDSNNSIHSILIRCFVTELYGLKRWTLLGQIDLTQNIQSNISNYYLYQAIWPSTESVYLILSCPSTRIIKKMALSLFPNGRQRAEIASLDFRNVSRMK